MKIARRVEEFIHTHRLMAPEARVLVALSGGADSVALLRVLLSLGYHCHGVHCNFHLRGEESNRDERFATELCQALGVECEVVHFDTMAYAAEHKVSVEMAARELRYGEFERLRMAHDLDAIAVAHHRDDAVETLLLNLIRGAGINGLTGMRVRNGHIIRPLLCLTRDEIIDYLDHLGQTYVTDSTNLTDIYARNKVRLQLLPLMEQINPAARSNIMQAAMHLGEAATLYNQTIEAHCAHIVALHAEGLDISIEALLACEEPAAHLFEILHPYGFNSSQVAHIFGSLNAEAGRVFYTKEYSLLRDRTLLMLRTLQPTTREEELYTLPHEGTLELPDGTTLTVSLITPDASWQVPRRSNVLCLDASRITEPLTLRHPRQGDRMSPFGMRGTKLLSDLYTDLKMPHTEKAKQWVLCHGDDIVWAVGLRSSERYRLRGEAERVICVEMRSER